MLPTNFPYIPGSSLRGSLRNEVANLDENTANSLFGKELNDDGQMGIHQVWFGDARLLWVPMRTMSFDGVGDIFTWVSCHSLIRAHAITTGSKKFISFPDTPIGTRKGTYWIADSQITVEEISKEQKLLLSLSGEFPESLKDSVKPILEKNCVVLSDQDFEILMEHSLWTQIRNKIQDNPDKEQAGSAEVFWTDICIPRDTIFYFNWGYNALKDNSINENQHELLIDIMQGLLQIGGQANIGRGWVQSWVNNKNLVLLNAQQKQTIGA
jgi:CRISPR-associated protein Cmr4